MKKVESTNQLVEKLQTGDDGERLDGKAVDLQDIQLEDRDMEIDKKKVLLEKIDSLPSNDSRPVLSEGKVDVSKVEQELVSATSGRKSKSRNSLGKKGSSDASYFNIQNMDEKEEDIQMQNLPKASAMNLAFNKQTSEKITINQNNQIQVDDEDEDEEKGSPDQDKKQRKKNYHLIVMDEESKGLAAFSLDDKTDPSLLAQTPTVLKREPSTAVEDDTVKRQKSLSRKERKEQFRKKIKCVFWTLFFLNFIRVFDNGIIPALVVTFKEDYGLTDSEIGMIGSLTYLGEITGK